LYFGLLQWVPVSAMSRVMASPNADGFLPVTGSWDTSGSSMVIPSGVLSGDLSYLTVVGLSACSGSEGPK